MCRVSDTTAKVCFPQRFSGREKLIHPAACLSGLDIHSLAEHRILWNLRNLCTLDQFGDRLGLQIHIVEGHFLHFHTHILQQCSLSVICGKIYIHNSNIVPAGKKERVIIL
jgi:hypothetical protein